jgi:hypothetical protein
MAHSISSFFLLSCATSAIRFLGPSFLVFSIVDILMVKVNKKPHPFGMRFLNKAPTAL